MASDALEVDCEDELPERHADTHVRPTATFVTCMNTAISCHFIDLGVPSARYVPVKSQQVRAYLGQVGVVARSHQVFIPYVDVQLSMGQLAALLLHKKIAPDLPTTRSIVAMLCYEETTETTPLCIKSETYYPRDLDEMCEDFTRALGVSSVRRERYGTDAMVTPVLNLIRIIYPHCCPLCIFNLSALAIKTTLCHEILCAEDPQCEEDRPRYASDLMCDIVCGYAFNAKKQKVKHNLMHLFQTAMLLETRFVSTCVKYSEEIAHKLTLVMFNKPITLADSHVNKHATLHQAICEHMGYDAKMVMPWVAVTAHIATCMFGTLGKNIIHKFLWAVKKQHAHCLLTDVETEAIVYFS